MDRESLWDHDPSHDAQPPEEPCVLCNGGSGLCRGCMATHTAEAKDLNDALDAVGTAARAIFAVQWHEAGVLGWHEEAEALRRHRSELRKALARLASVLGVRP